METLKMKSRKRIKSNFLKEKINITNAL